MSDTEKQFQAYLRDVERTIGNDIEVGLDEQAYNELSSVKEMIDLATEQGLLVEVVDSFGQHRFSNVPTVQATLFALVDWDI